MGVRSAVAKFALRHASITATAQDLINNDPRNLRGLAGNKTPFYVTAESSLKHSAVWACLRLRADLVSSMPVDVYRDVDGQRLEVRRPPVLVNPSDGQGINEWLYSTQFELDRCGNVFGIISERNGRGLPSRIDLVPSEDVSFRIVDYRIAEYRIRNVVYDPHDIWHEKQYTVPGVPFGLSPVALAASSISESMSAQQFALNWFAGDAVPAGVLAHKEKTIEPKFADEVKMRFQQKIRAGEVFVHGADWEYKVIQATANQTNFIESREFGIPEISRFFGVPADLIDGAVSNSSLTYGTITQRNLQFLIMSLGPTVIRRENALTRLTASPHYVKLNTDALLRLDPLSRAQTLQIQRKNWALTPDEWRELEDREPLTEAQMLQLERISAKKESGEAEERPSDNDTNS